MTKDVFVNNLFKAHSNNSYDMKNLFW